MGHLRFDMQSAYDAEEKGHPQKVMEKLGITYQHATPQSMGDQWWFWNCENLPEKLPAYFSKLEMDPMDCVGYGLSKEDAIRIKIKQES